MQRTILGCLYTRHYDGFVRQQWVRTILDAEHLWVAPFVIQLLGEYVPEIIDDIAEALRARPAEPYGRFITENPSSTHSSGNEQSAAGNGFFLRDLDGDGRDEVLIMTGCGGTGGENLAIWRATGDSTQFVRAGETFGFLNFWRTTDGFVAQYAHSSAASGVVSLYEFVGDRLVRAAALEVAVASFDDPYVTHSWIVTGNTKCALSRGGRPSKALEVGDERLKAHGIDPVAAEQHLCASLGDYYAKR
ncbi:hypothetical protein [Mycobacteroides abscessus]|uniref:hypothetical protein n=1 Tax=Mycobacteroides abscessus TaxID=36809 RepID=UPI00119CDF18|nr:hypothetical protein [Mycobacteroides abscessus]